jgi:hypothetical protein
MGYIKGCNQPTKGAIISQLTCMWAGDRPKQLIVFPLPDGVWNIKIAGGPHVWKQSPMFDYQAINPCKMEVPEIGAPPKSSILNGLPTFNPPFWGTPHLWKLPNEAPTTEPQSLPVELWHPHLRFCFSSALPWTTELTLRYPAKNWNMW